MKQSLILFSTFLYGQNDSVKNEQLNNYKERDYAVPNSNPNMQLPTSKSSIPILTNEEVNAYPV